MLLHWIGFAYLIMLSIALIFSRTLNLLGCGDKTGTEHKKSNLISCIIGIGLIVIVIYNHFYKFF